MFVYFNIWRGRLFDPAAILDTGPASRGAPVKRRDKGDKGNDSGCQSFPHQEPCRVPPSVFSHTSHSKVSKTTIHSTKVPRL